MQGEGTRRRLTPRRFAFVAVVITLSLAVGLCGIVGGRILAMRVPPGGRLVAQRDGYRVYVVPNNDPATLRSLKDWAHRWGNRTDSSFSGYGGNLALITVDSSGVTVIKGERYPVPKGHLQVCVHDSSLSVSTLWERAKQVFTGRL